METDSDFILNEHNKDEFAPAHTAEHLLNQTMIRMFGCKRSTNAHVERKKSKITYILERKPSRKDEKEIERRMNELIGEDLPVRYKYVTRQDIPDGVEPRVFYFWTSLLDQFYWVAASAAGGYLRRASAVSLKFM